MQVEANSQLTFAFFIHYVYIIVFIFSIIWTIYSSPMSPDNQGSTACIVPLTFSSLKTPCCDKW